MNDIARSTADSGTMESVKTLLLERTSPPYWAVRYFWIQDTVFANISKHPLQTKQQASQFLHAKPGEDASHAVIPLTQMDTLLPNWLWARKLRVATVDFDLDL